MTPKEKAARFAKEKVQELWEKTGFRVDATDLEQLVLAGVAWRSRQKCLNCGAIVREVKGGSRK